MWYTKANLTVVGYNIRDKETGGKQCPSCGGRCALVGTVPGPKINRSKPVKVYVCEKCGRRTLYKPADPPYSVAEMVKEAILATKREVALAMAIT